MKQLLSLIIGLLYTSTVYSMCKISGLSVFPNGPTINQNCIFIVDGYANSQTIISGLNKKYPIYLKSGNKKIKLLVTEIYKGQFHLTQAILKPETLLEAGLDYTICIDNLPEFESLGKYNSTTGKDDPITYKVSAGKDLEKPQLSELPKELEKEFTSFGCGPSMHVIFSSPAKDNSDIIVKTTVKNLTTGKETTYYIEPEENKIEVGHGMCAGAFNFDESNNYEVEFSFMDASGNFRAWSGERIKFTKPTPKNN